MKIYYAGDIPEQRNQVGIFLGGTTILGNSWRPYLLKKLEEHFADENIDVFVPESRDSTISTWDDFHKTMPSDFNMIEWEKTYGSKCYIWTMYLPTYANKFDSGPEFASPSSDPFKTYPNACKGLQLLLQTNEITQEQYDTELLKLTMANIGCQVRFEAGYLVGRNTHNVVWGKVYNSLQISFGPYLKNSQMHVLEKNELKIDGHLVPDTFVVELVEKIKFQLNHKFHNKW